MTPSSIVHLEKCCCCNTINLPCVTLIQPKVIEFCKREFDISFLHDKKTVESVMEALHIVKILVPWTTVSEDKLKEIIKALETWNFPTPRLGSKTIEVAFRFGLQHFYRNCCICEGSKLIYDESYFRDLSEYLDGGGNSSAKPVRLPPRLICETVSFIDKYQENIDIKCEASTAATSTNVQPLDILSLFEAKNLIVSFIRELLTLDYGVNDSVLKFFSKQWLSNIDGGSYQFTSRDAFCLFFNNVSVFQFATDIMFLVPDFSHKFTRRLVVPEKCILNREKRNFNQTTHAATCQALQEPHNEIAKILRQVCGVYHAEYAVASFMEMEERATEKMQRTPSMAIRMCPTGGRALTLDDGWLRTVSELLGSFEQSSDTIYSLDDISMDSDDMASTFNSHVYGNLPLVRKSVESEQKSNKRFKSG